MNKILGVSLLVAFIIFGAVSTTTAGKPLDEQGIYVGNGFPSGPHFNLNIIAKKDQFTCPAQEYLCVDEGIESTVASCDECSGTCTPIYGGVIFVPQEPAGDPITILMESGAKGPKGNTGATSLEVTNPCTQTFDGDAASFRLPANAEGYAVYARVVGDPKQNPQFDFTNPRFKYVMDESGNDLWLMGFVTNSVFDSDGEALPSRYDGSQKGKGVQKAVDITSLFLWSGDVCYLEQSDAVDYCGWVDSDGDGIVDEGELECAVSNYCCIDVDDNADYEYCQSLQTGYLCTDLTVPTDLCCNDLDSEFLGPEICAPGDTETCIEPSELLPGPFVYESITAFCKHYGNESSGEWVFNIADFVGMLFDVQSDAENTGSSVIQIRFYPLPLSTL